MAARIEMRRDGEVVTLTLSHPGKLNALTVSMWQAIGENFRSVSADESVRCVVVRGAGGNFAAGADISEFPEVRGTEAQVRHYHEELLAPTLRAVRDCPQVVIAAIEGVCVGGGLEIAMLCDLRLAAVGSRFGAPIARLGFPMAPDELEPLVTTVGAAVSAELLLEGRILSAEEAAARGIVTRVVPAETFEDELDAMIRRILAGGPQATRWNKRLIRHFARGGQPLGESERAEFFAYAETAEHRNGVASFLKLG